MFKNLIKRLGFDDKNSGVDIDQISKYDPESLEVRVLKGPSIGNVRNDIHLLFNRTISNGDTTKTLKNRYLESLPVINESDVNDIEGLNYATIETWAEKYDIPKLFLECCLRNCISIKGINGKKETIVLYSEKDVKFIYKHEYNFPKIDKDGFYTDKEGNRHATLSRWSDVIDAELSVTELERRLIGTNPEIVKGHIGERIKVYSEYQVQKFL